MATATLETPKTEPAKPEFKSPEKCGGRMPRKGDQVVLVAPGINGQPTEYVAWLFDFSNISGLWTLNKMVFGGFVGVHNVRFSPTGESGTWHWQPFRDDKKE